MTLLTCARRHRALLWSARVRSRRRGGRSPRSARVAATGLAAAAASAKQPPLSTTSRAASTLSQSQSPPKTDNSLAMARENAAASNGTSERPERESAAPETSWSAMLIALFGLIQPEWAKESKAEVEDECADELRVNSVPPHVSDVVASSDKGIFWRFDMESYAANRHNEDRSQHVVDSISDHKAGAQKPVFFCACYDGHGGEEAVDFVQQFLYANIRSHLDTGAEPVAHAIISGFKDTDEEFMRRSQLKFARGSWSSCSVGACVVTALVMDQTLYVASCGDCRAIMAFREPDGSLTVEQITSDHSANEEREQRRLRVLHPEDYDIVREIGFKNYYVKGRLQPTRSIGDTYMKVKDVNRSPMPRGLRISGSFKRPYISSVPDVFQIDLRDRRPEFVVLGSDGLFGELANEEVVKLVAHFRAKGAANVSLALREAVLNKIAGIYGISPEEMEDISPGDRRNYHDDITIDVLHFVPPEEVADAVAPGATAA